MIIASDGVNVGASFTTCLLHQRKPVKHIFTQRSKWLFSARYDASTPLSFPALCLTLFCPGLLGICVAHPTLTSCSSSPVSGWKRMAMEINSGCRVPRLPLFQRVCSRTGRGRAALLRTCRRSEVLLEVLVCHAHHFE